MPVAGQCSLCLCCSLIITAGDAQSKLSFLSSSTISWLFGNSVPVQLCSAASLPAEHQHQRIIPTTILCWSTPGACCATNVLVCCKDTRASCTCLQSPSANTYVFTKCWVQRKGPDKQGCTKYLLHLGNDRRKASSSGNKLLLVALQTPRCVSCVVGLVELALGFACPNAWGCTCRVGLQRGGTFERGLLRCCKLLLVVLQLLGVTRPWTVRKLVLGQDVPAPGTDSITQAGPAEGHASSCSVAASASTAYHTEHRPLQAEHSEWVYLRKYCLFLASKLEVDLCRQSSKHASTCCNVTAWSMPASQRRPLQTVSGKLSMPLPCQRRSLKAPQTGHR